MDPSRKQLNKLPVLAVILLPFLAMAYMAAYALFAALLAQKDFSLQVQGNVTPVFSRYECTPCTHPSAPYHEDDNWRWIQ